MKIHTSAITPQTSAAQSSKIRAEARNSFNLALSRRNANSGNVALRFEIPFCSMINHLFITRQIDVRLARRKTIPVETGRLLRGNGSIGQARRELIKPGPRALELARQPEQRRLIPEARGELHADR